MTEPVPNDGISAFFDEEVSASEREAIAHHLSRSADAQAELAQIRRLSEELRRLPREAAPANLRAEVVGRTAKGSAKKATAALRSWGFWGKWLAPAAALGLLLAWIPSLWNPSPQESPMIAATPGSAEVAQSDVPGETRGAPAAVRLGSEEEMLAQKTPDRKMVRGFGGAAAPAQPSFLPVPGPPSPAGMTAGRMNLMVAGDEPTPADPEMERILQLASRHAEGVVIVEITAENRQRTLAEFQQLLARNSVAPAGVSPPPEPGADAKDRLPISLYVQSSPEQMAKALSELRRRNPIAQIQPQTAVAMRETPASEIGDKNEEGGEKLTRFRRSLEDSLKYYEQSRAEGFGADMAKKELDTADAAPAEKVEPKPVEASPAENLPAAPARAAFQAEMVRSADQAPAVKSFQMLVQTSRDAGPPKNPEMAERPPREVPTDASPPEPAEDKQNVQAQEAARAPGGAGPVRLMFIFRERPAHQGIGSAGGTQEK